MKMEENVLLAMDQSHLTNEKPATLNLNWNFMVYSEPSKPSAFTLLELKSLR